MGTTPFGSLKVKKHKLQEIGHPPEIQIRQPPNIFLAFQKSLSLQFKISPAANIGTARSDIRPIRGSIILSAL